MDRYRLYPIYLLSSSLVVLVIMFTVRAVTNNNQTFDRNLSRTTDSGVVATEDIQTNKPTESPVPSETATLEPTSTILIATETQPPTATESAPTVIDDGCNVAGFVADVTVPDGAVFKPGAKFTKTWRLINNGTCTWNNNYKLYYYSGEKMSGPDSQQMITIPVPPGTIIEISVDLVAPTEVGEYKGNWALKDPDGNHFGIGPLKNPFYVKIRVKDPLASATDTPVP